MLGPDGPQTLGTGLTYGASVSSAGEPFARYNAAQTVTRRSATLILSRDAQQ
jgi:hypothetical protein